MFSLYFNNMIISSDDVDGISVLKAKLAQQFEMSIWVPYDISWVLR